MCSAADVGEEESWVEFYSQMHERVVYLQRASGLVAAELPGTAVTYYPS